ncbi:MAG TPA: class I SAM-dependent methyltransferase [Gammaproteobacteria bacterium]|nr:class I SAM-dependent methyltransferase [Gammaproteobacteria bacterium]
MDRQKMMAMAERVYRDVAGAMATGLGYLGVESGLFAAMRGRGPMRLEEVVAASGLVRRYVEEWLNGMVAAGYLDYDAEAATYTLPEEHAFLLSSAGTDHYMGGMFGMPPPLLAQAPRLLRAMHEGGGVPFGDFAPECRHAIDAMNRGNYERRLVDYWLAQLPDIAARLQAGGRVLDVGCGHGHAAIALAKGYPASEIVGVDPDAASIAEARAAAGAAGVKVEFVQATLDAMPRVPPFDLVTVCDSLHDLPDPVAVLEQIRARLAEDGALFVIELKVSDRLEENRHPIAAMFYGFSMFHCLTQSLAHGGAGLGACLGPTKTLALFAQAGFSRAEPLAIKSPTNLFYAARP